MATYLPIQCPLLWEEMRRRLRGFRANLIFMVFTGILTFLLYPQMSFGGEGMLDDPRNWSQFGKILWYFFLMGQLIVITLLSPGLTAGSMSYEREQSTMELLLLTRMSSISIVLGKFLGAIGMMLLILLSGVPVVAVVFFFGGVSPLEIVTGYLIILTSGIAFAAVGFIMSCMCSRIATAVTWAYSITLIVLVGWPLFFFSMTSASGMGGAEAELMFYFVSTINPFFATIAHIETMQNGGMGMNIALWPTLVAMPVIALLLLAECVMIVRRMRGLSRRFVSRRVPKPVPSSRRPAEVQD